MTWRDRISIDQHICHGKPCIKGTRVMVTTVLDNLAAGETTNSIATAYHITAEDVSAALQYASELANNAA